MREGACAVRSRARAPHGARCGPRGAAAASARSGPPGPPPARARTAAGPPGSDLRVCVSAWGGWLVYDFCFGGGGLEELFVFCLGVAGWKHWWVTLAEKEMVPLFGPEALKQKGI